MRLLDDCLALTRELKELDEKIFELKTTMLSPKGQIITGMPRSGGPNGNKADDYMVRLERLEERKKRAKGKREKVWNEAVAIFQKKHIKGEYVELMKLRFYRGLQWKQCCAPMCEKYPTQSWNINKIFRVYRQILRIER